LVTVVLGVDIFIQFPKQKTLIQKIWNGFDQNTIVTFVRLSAFPRY